MKIFHAVSKWPNYETQWRLPDYREALWCAAFEIEDLDGAFDMVPAERMIPVLTAAIEKFDTHTEELRALRDPQDVMDLRGNKRILQGMRSWLIQNEGHLSGVFDDSELEPLEGDAVVVPDQA